MMQGIGKVKFKRAVVPEYAVNLNINITDAADASKELACIAIYARFLQEDGTYMCSRGVVVITTAQIYSTKPKHRFCAGSNPSRSVSEIHNNEDL